MSLRVGSAACLLAAVVCVAVNARGQCPTNLSVTPPDADGNIVIDASANGGCAGTRIDVFIDGSGVASNNCPSAADCHVIQKLFVGCFKGNHSVTAQSECHYQQEVAPGVTTCSRFDHGQNSAGFFVAPKPQVNLTYSGPDEEGHGIAHVAYSFPYAGQGKRVRFYVDGQGVAETTPTVASATWDIPYNFTCGSPGDHPMVAQAFACSAELTGDADFTASDTKTVSVAGQTTVTGSYDDDSQTLTLSTRFQNTDHLLQRGLNVYVDGALANPPGFATGCVERVSGTCASKLQLSCGVTHQIRIVAQGCSRPEPMYNAEDSFSVIPICDNDATSCSLSPSSSSEFGDSIAGSNAGPSCPGLCPGSPVHVGSGDVSVTIALFALADSPMSLPFTMTYHSARPTFPDSIDDPLGVGWTHLYNQSIRDVGLSRLQLYTPAGNRFYFDRLTSSLWTASKPGYVSDTIIRAGDTYVLKYPNGGNSTFSVATGRWLSTSDRWGNSRSGTYNATGNLTAITDAEGRQVTLEYAGNLVTRIILPNGAAWRFEYATTPSSPVLSAIYEPTHPDQAWRRFQYTMQSDGVYRSLTEVRDSAGKLLEGHAYDSSGFNRGLTSVVEGGRDSYTFEYNTPLPGQTRVTRKINDALSQVTVYTLQRIKGSIVATQIDGVCAACGMVTDSQTFTYDTLGHITSTTDAGGHVSRYTYDRFGDVLTRTEAAGTGRERSTTFFYDLPSWPTFVTKVTLPSATGNGLKTILNEWSPDETVLTTTESGKLNADLASATSYVRTTTFDAKHRIVSEDGPRTDVSDVTTRAYHADVDPDPIRRGRLRQITNAVGLTTTLDDYDVYGTARRATDPNGVVTQIQTDLRGRVTSTTSRAVSGDPNETADYTFTTVYDAGDRVTEIASPRGGKTRYVYEDGTNRLTDVIRLDSSGNDVERKHLTVNLIGEKIAEEDQACAAPAPVCATWITRRSVSFVYDAKDRLIEIDQPLPAGAKILYAYDADGRLQSVQDENHSSPNSVYVYDELQRLITFSQISAVTRYTYDAQDHLAAVTDPNGNVTTYSFDDFGRMQRQVSPVTGTTSYTYDPAGNLTVATDANGATTTRAYDAANRVLSATSARAGAETENVIWIYDDGTPGNYGRGRIASMADPTGSTLYRYERRGLLTRELKTIQGAAYTSGFTYDANGNRTSVAYPSGRTVTYAYDFADRPLSASSGSATLVASAGYLPFGPEASLQFGNGTTRVMQYDVRYRPLENRLSGPLGLIADSMYGEDAVGNITQIHDALNAVYDRDFAYDDWNRLTAANTGAALWGAGTYRYDAMGNLLALSRGDSRSVFVYSGTTPKLISVTENGASRSVAYDPAGNETAVGAEAFDYSSRNFLSIGSARGYLYDGRGVRVVTSVPLAISSLALAGSTLTGGHPATGTITLNASAPPGGATIVVSSDSASASPPPSVTIAEGAITSTFSIPTSAVATQTVAKISAVLGSSSSSASLTIVPPVPTVLSITPSSVFGAGIAAAAVSLSGPAPASALILTVSTSSSIVTAPGMVTVPAGSTGTTFEVAGSAVTSDATAVVSVSANGVTQTASLLVRATHLSGVTVIPTAVTGGDSATLALLLDSPAPANGALVTITSNRPEVIVPASVTIPAGAVTVSVPVTTSVVGSSVTVTIAATYANGTKSATLIVNPPPVSIASLTIDPATVVGGLPATGTVTLTLPAPSAGALIVLSSDDASIASVPPALTVPAGAITATFPIATSTILTSTVVTISGAFNGLTKSAPLTVQAPTGVVLYRLTIDPPNVAGGSATTGTVTLNAPAPNGGADIPLTSSNPATVRVASRVTVKRGDMTATFDIKTVAVTAPVVVEVSGSYGGLTQRDSVTVIPATAITLVQLTLSPPTIAAGGSGVGSVTMSAPAPAGGVLVSIVIKHRNVASAPVSVIVPGGATSASFPITTERVHTTKTTDVSATYAGVTRTATLTVTPSVVQLRERDAPVALEVTAALTSAPVGAHRYSFYTPELNLMAESGATSGTPPIAYEYVWFGGKPVVQIETATNKVHYYFTDHLGTPVLTTDASGAVDWRVEYEPYGTVFTTRTGADRHQPLRFPGQEFDSDAPERSYNIFRWYRAGWGRYAQPDPIGLWAGFNLFVYAGDDPANGTDRLGLVVRRCFRPFATARARATAALVEAVFPAWGIIQPPVPGVSQCLMHEYLYNTDPRERDHPSQGYDPVEDRTESGRDICYDIHEPLGSCVWRNFRRIRGNPSAYDLRTHNCQTTINQTIAYCLCTRNAR